ncbi:MAG: AMIN domain-containing protein [Desulfofustis sp.]|nr:AMIN domain-containing protein [Desulfofustis sp.]
MNRPRSIVPIVLALLIIVFGVQATHATTPSGSYPDKSDLKAHYQKAKFFYNQLHTSAKLGAVRENWLKGAGNFRRIYLAEPKSELAPACLFMLGRLYYDAFKKFGEGIDLGESISYYRDVNTLFPGNRLADDALYAVGAILYEDMNDPRRAAETFTKIISNYPDGDMGTPAETRLKRLSKDYDIPLPEEMLGTTPMAKLTNVKPAKYWSSKDYTRVVVQTSGPTEYREELLEKVGNRPRRLYIDFRDSYIEPRFRSPIPIEDGLLKRIRTGQFSPDTVRVVLDIESISDYKIFSLPDPFRVVIDVRGKKKNQHIETVAPLSPPPAPPQPLPQPRPSIAQKSSTPSESVASPEQTVATVESEPTEPVPAETVLSEAPRPDMVARIPPEIPTTSETERLSADPGPVVVLREMRKRAVPVDIAPSPIEGDIPRQQLSLAQQLGLGIGTIVLDPGHGGKDPGAIAFGMKEKDIVLKMGKRLAVHLREKLGATVILTRKDDSFMPLEERTAIANTNSADLFVSLHINAHPSPDIRGFETYFLNLTTNAEAMRVAARENATSTHQLSDLQDILSDILQNSKINESSRLAERVHDSIDNGFSESHFALKNMGVKQAPFYVLIGAEMPAILIEIAFISNPDDAKLLGDKEFIDKLAEQISDGISLYANANVASTE